MTSNPTTAGTSTNPSQPTPPRTTRRINSPTHSGRQYDSTEHLTVVHPLVRLSGPLEGKDIVDDG
ncbi:hypothetical protein, partial [Rhodococcus globerulus]|uniref:hypothetical protein n=1 Tax=Rhodococcus globerulus TaxID=33008 RepID=UPI00294B738B